MKQRSPLLPIFLIVLVDVLGFTIVIPLLALYAERFGASTVTLPLFTLMTESDVARVCDAVEEICEHYGKEEE